MLFYFIKVTRADYLSGRTALHFAAVNGHVRCIRLVVTDFVPSAPFEAINTQIEGERGDGSGVKNKSDQRCVFYHFTEPPCAPADSDLNSNGELGPGLLQVFLSNIVKKFNQKEKVILQKKLSFGMLK